jgi:hypothetical protein
MRNLIGCALGAAMLTGLGLAPAQAGVIGPVSSEAVATDDAAITKTTYYGYGGYGGYGYPRYYGYYPRRYYGYGYYPRRSYGYGYGYYPRRHYGYRYW